MVLKRVTYELEGEYSSVQEAVQVAKEQEESQHQQPSQQATESSQSSQAQEKRQSQAQEQQTSGSGSRKLPSGPIPLKEQVEQGLNVEKWERIQKAKAKVKAVRAFLQDAQQYLHQIYVLESEAQSLGLDSLVKSLENLASYLNKAIDYVSKRVDEAEANPDLAEELLKYVQSVEQQVESQLASTRKEIEGRRGEIESEASKLAKRLLEIASRLESVAKELREVGKGGLVAEAESLASECRQLASSLEKLAKGQNLSLWQTILSEARSLLQRAEAQLGSYQSTFSSIKKSLESQLSKLARDLKSIAQRLRELGDDEWASRAESEAQRIEGAVSKHDVSSYGSLLEEGRRVLEDARRSLNARIQTLRRSLQSLAQQLEVLATQLDRLGANDLANTARQEAQKIRSILSSQPGRQWLQVEDEAQSLLNVLRSRMGELEVKQAAKKASEEIEKETKRVSEEIKKQARQVEQVVKQALQSVDKIVEEAKKSGGDPNRVLACIAPQVRKLWSEIGSVLQGSPDRASLARRIMDDIARRFGFQNTKLLVGFVVAGLATYESAFRYESRKMILEKCREVMQAYDSGRVDDNAIEALIWLGVYAVPAIKDVVQRASEGVAALSVGDVAGGIGSILGIAHPQEYLPESEWEKLVRKVAEEQMNRLIELAKEFARGKVIKPDAITHLAAEIRDFIDTMAYIGSGRALADAIASGMQRLAESLREWAKSNRELAPVLNAIANALSLTASPTASFATGAALRGGVEAASAVGGSAAGAALAAVTGAFAIIDWVSRLSDPLQRRLMSEAFKKLGKDPKLLAELLASIGAGAAGATMPGTAMARAVASALRRVGATELAEKVEEAFGLGKYAARVRTVERIEKAELRVEGGRGSRSRVVYVEKGRLTPVSVQLERLPSKLVYDLGAIIGDRGAAAEVIEAVLTRVGRKGLQELERALGERGLTNLLASLYHSLRNAGVAPDQLPRQLAEYVEALSKIGSNARSVARVIESGRPGIVRRLLSAVKSLASRLGGEGRIEAIRIAGGRAIVLEAKPRGGEMELVIVGPRGTATVRVAGYTERALEELRQALRRVGISPSYAEQILERALSRMGETIAGGKGSAVVVMAREGEGAVPSERGVASLSEFMIVRKRGRGVEFRVQKSYAFTSPEVRAQITALIRGAARRAKIGNVEYELLQTVEVPKRYEQAVVRALRIALQHEEQVKTGGLPLRSIVIQALREEGLPVTEDAVNEIEQAVRALLYETREALLRNLEVIVTGYESGDRAIIALVGASVGARTGVGSGSSAEPRVLGEEYLMEESEIEKEEVGASPTPSSSSVGRTGGESSSPRPVVVPIYRVEYMTGWESSSRYETSSASVPGSRVARSPAPVQKLDEFEIDYSSGSRKIASFSIASAEEPGSGNVSRPAPVTRIEVFLSEYRDTASPFEVTIPRRESRFGTGTFKEPAPVVKVSRFRPEFLSAVAQSLYASVSSSSEEGSSKVEEGLSPEFLTTEETVVSYYTVFREVEVSTSKGGGGGKSHAEATGGVPPMPTVPIVPSPQSYGFSEQEEEIVTRERVVI